MQSPRPIRTFMLWFFPGAALALCIATLAMRYLPELALVALLSLGFLSYTVGVSAAVSGPVPQGVKDDRQMVALLALRRKRVRYAFVFALLAAATGALSLSLMAQADLTPAFRPSVGHVGLTVAVLFIAAWLVIGESACSQARIRRALLTRRERA